ncbi:Ig-like domain-containing protein [Vibrio campbellii]|uniref:Ig-like domain-containing protein n=1 Tax=Vibrio campbellii TaxID=680 RepID=UPI00142E1FB0|nr:Ig-like domain-containing protein [Vibrio campbellii]NIY89203.1 DUF1566 domain-containing protein [Vibrio campbellii]NVK69912.1 Ig-like domain-containing protein [Vibrio campbellii]
MNRNLSQWLTIMWCSLTVLMMSACNEKQSFSTPISEPPPSVDVEISSLSLSVSGASNIPVGLNGYVSAIATYSDGETRNVTSQVSWSLDNESFSRNGLTNDGEQRFKAAEGKDGAKTEISATFDGVKSENSVTLSVSSAVVQALKVTPPRASSPAGLSQQFYASAVMSDGQVLDVTSEEVVAWRMGEQAIESGRTEATKQQVGETLTVAASLTVGGQSFLSEASLEVSELVMKGLIVEPADGEVWNSDLAVQGSRELVARAILSDNTVVPLHHSDVRWSTSANSAYVAVSKCEDAMCANGLASGQESVIASSGNFSDDFIFNVVALNAPQGQVIGTETQLRKGGAMHLKFIAKSSDGSFADLTSSPDTIWVLSDTEFAHMEGNKLIAAPTGGYDPELDYPASKRVTVMARNGALSGQYDVELLDAQIMSLVISPSTDTKVAYGHNLQLEAFITYSDGVQKNVTSSSEMNWSTSDASDAYFDNIQKGLLVTAEPESLTVTGKFNGLTQASSMIVTVNAQQPRELSLSPTVGYRVGQPQSLTLTLSYDDGSVQKLAFDDSVSVAVTEWSGTSETQPAVNGEGVFYAAKPGTATLTATKTFEDKSAVSVVEKVDIREASLISTLAVSPKAASLAPGQSQQVEAYALDTNGQVIALLPSQVNYSLGDDETGSWVESSTGVFYAGSMPGSVTLTVAMKQTELVELVSGQVPTQTVPIEVVAKQLQAIEVQLPEGLTLIPGQKVALSALGRYNDDSSAPLSNDTVEWSKNPAMTDAFELVDNDLDGHVDTLKAVKAGSGRVTVTYKDAPSITGTSGLITVDNATITDMDISPDIETLPVGFSQTFEAFAVADTGANAKLNEDQVSWTVTSDVGVSGTDNGDGTYTVESKGAGVAVTVTASLNADAFPDVSGNDLNKEETFTTVPADITNLVVEPLDGSTVVVGVPYRLRAEAVQANGELFDATYKVDWTSDDSTVDIDEIAKTVTFSEGSNDSVTLTATPNDDSFGEYATPATSTVTVLKPEAKGILVTPPEVTIDKEESTKLKAYAYYSYGKEPLDVTESVTWSVEDTGDGDLGVIVNAGLVTSSTQVGVVKVTATDDAGNSNFSVVMVSPVPPMCGNVVDDTDPDNAKGACLKVASDSAGNWFTSTPSIAVMDALGYKGPDDDPTANSDTNSGDTYAGTYTAGSSGPTNGEFAQFRQDGNGVINPNEGDDANAGVDGQLDRWCQKLASLNFAGKNDWHRPTKDELTGLYSHVGGSLWNKRGWPTGSHYWSTTVKSSGYSIVGLHYGSVTSYHPRNVLYASCVSNP